MLKKEEDKKVQGEALEVPAEMVYSPTGLSFDLLTKYIPKVEKESRIKVWKDQSGNYNTSTKVGMELAAAYKMVGFSFIPILLVEEEEEEKISRAAFGEAAANAFNAAAFWEPVPRNVPGNQRNMFQALRAELEAANAGHPARVPVGGNAPRRRVRF